MNNQRLGMSGCSLRLVFLHLKLTGQSVWACRASGLLKPISFGTSRHFKGKSGVLACRWTSRFTRMSRSRSTHACHYLSPCARVCVCVPPLSKLCLNSLYNTETPNSLHIMQAAGAWKRKPRRRIRCFIQLNGPDQSERRKRRRRVNHRRRSSAD